MSTFVGTSPFFISALCVVMETMRFHIAQMGLFFRAIFFPIQVVSQNILTHIKSFPDGARLVLLDPMVLRNVHAVTFYTFYTFYGHKMYNVFEHVHYDIFILKQNNLLIINISFSFII